MTFVKAVTGPSRWMAPFFAFFNMLRGVFMNAARMIIGGFNAFRWPAVAFKKVTGFFSHWAVKHLGITIGAAVAVFALVAAISYALLALMALFSWLNLYVVAEAAYIMLAVFTVLVQIFVPALVLYWVFMRTMDLFSGHAKTEHDFDVKEAQRAKERSYSDRTITVNIR